MTIFSVSYLDKSGVSTVTIFARVVLFLFLSRISLGLRTLVYFGILYFYRFHHISSCSRQFFSHMRIVYLSSVGNCFKIELG